MEMTQISHVGPLPLPSGEGRGEGTWQSNGSSSSGPLTLTLSRRERGPVLLLLTALFSVAPLASAQVPKLDRVPGVTPRNVVFILSDDHRYDALGFMNHPFLKTPNLDALAANGAHVRNAFVTTA